jgi:hypothetical protein
MSKIFATAVVVALLLPPGLPTQSFSLVTKNRISPEGAIAVQRTVYMPMVFGRSGIFGLGNPTIIQRTPDFGEEIGAGGVEFVFDRAMNRASVEAALDTEPTVTGEKIWKDDRTFVFKPSIALPQGSSLVVTIGSEARAQDGLPLRDAIHHRMRLADELKVLQVVPANDTSDLTPSADNVITVMFNRPVVPLALSGDLPQPLSFDPPIAGRQVWLNTATLVFYPNAPLPAGRRIVARVSPIADVQDVAMPSAFTWAFSTAPPKVLNIAVNNPAGYYSYLDQKALDASISVQFNQAVDAESARTAFRLTKVGGGAVAGNTLVVGADFIFTPTVRLDYDSSYEIAIASGVRAVGGGIGSTESASLRFSTVPLPRLISTSPVNTARDVSPYDSVILNFNAPIRIGNVMSYVTFTPAVSVTGKLHESESQSVYLPVRLKPNTIYNVSIRAGIADRYGNRTQSPTALQFSTGDYPYQSPYAIFDETFSNVSTMSTLVPAKISVHSVNVTRINFTLWQINRAHAETVLSEATRDGNTWRNGATVVRQWTQNLSTPRNEFVSSSVSLLSGNGALNAGLYAIEMNVPESNGPNRLTFLAVSPYHLTMKSEASRVMVWANDMATGQPTPQLPLLYRGAKIATNDDGIAIFNNTSGQTRNIVVSENTAPFAAVSSDWWVSAANAVGFDGSYSLLSGQRVYIYTDRPIYRPGHTVKIRAIVRNENDARYSLPSANTKIPIVVFASQDTSGAPAYEFTLTTDANGVAVAELPLKTNAITGQYRLSIRPTESRPWMLESSGFTVATYRPVEHEVLFPSPITHATLGENALAEVQARYLFGAMMRNTHVAWKLYASPTTFRPAGFDRFTFSDSDSPYGLWEDWWRPASLIRTIAQGNATTNNDGKASITLPVTRVVGMTVVGGTAPLAMTLEASVTSPSAQTVAGQMSFMAHPAQYYVGMSLPSWLLNAGQANALDIVAVDWASNRVGNKSIEVSLYRREWQANPTSGQYEPNDTLIITQTTTSQANGNVRVNLNIPANGGMYRIVARSRDEGGRLAQSTMFAWALGTNERWFTSEKVAQLHLVPNKAEFEPGETATLLIPSPYKSPEDGNQYALITLERGYVYEQVVRRLTGSSLVYELPISKDHAPNIFVSVVLFKGTSIGQFADPALMAGVVNLRVKPSKQTLNVSVRANQSNALSNALSNAMPGDNVEYTLQIRDADGVPVSGQFSLDMVDKGVLNLKSRKEGELIDAFYSARSQRVNTAAGLAVSAETIASTATPSPVSPVSAVSTAAPAPTQTVRDNAESSSNNNSASVRENFQDTAYWNPFITTDGEGIARVVIRLADNLTTWVLRAVGADAQTRVGEGSTQLITTKPLLLQPITPRFMVAGDVVSLGAVVQNTTNTALVATVWLNQSDGFRLNSPVTQTATIPANGNVTVRWQGVALDAPQADLIFATQAQANGTTLNDFTRPRLSTAPNGGIKILRYSTPETVGTAGTLAQEGGRTEYVIVPPKWSASELQGNLDMRLEPSLAAAVQNGLTALDYTQHGFKDCVECVLSELIPNVMNYAALREFKQLNPALAAKLNQLIGDRLSQLYEMQNSDGGFGWRYLGRWQSNPHITAYAVFGLVRANDAGFDINANALSRAIVYLQSQIQPLEPLTEAWRVNAQPYIAYVLAESGQSHSATTNALYNQRAKLDLHGLALLTLAIGRANSNDARLQTLFAELNTRAVSSATGIHWENGITCYWCMSTNTHATALVLSAMARHDPNNPLAPNAVRWLMSNRINNKTHAWNSTYETAWVLIGLIDWMRATNEQKGNYSYVAAVNSTQVARGTVNATNLITPVLASVSISQLNRDESNTVQIERSAGDGRLYYTLHLVAGVSAKLARASNRGIEVQRRFTAANCGDGDRCPEVRQLKVGDLLRVQVSVLAPSDLYHVEVNDTLPAGMEIVDPEFNTTPSATNPPSNVVTPVIGIGRPMGPASVETTPFLHPWWWWRWQWYSTQQFRDEGVLLFAPYLSQGSYQYTYVVRATLPGEFNVIPAFAQERYFPEVYGRSDGALVKVVP